MEKPLVFRQCAPATYLFFCALLVLLGLVAVVFLLYVLAGAILHSRLDVRMTWTVRFLVVAGLWGCTAYSFRNLLRERIEITNEEILDILDDGSVRASGRRDQVEALEGIIAKDGVRYAVRFAGGTNLYFPGSIQGCEELKSNLEMITNKKFVATSGHEEFLPHPNE